MSNSSCRKVRRSCCCSGVAVFFANELTSSWVILARDRSCADLIKLTCALVLAASFPSCESFDRMEVGCFREPGVSSGKFVLGGSLGTWLDTECSQQLDLCNLWKVVQWKFYTPFHFVSLVYSNRVPCTTSNAHYEVSHTKTI